MIGFDRPLKPEWIYTTLKMIEPGENPSKYNLPFEDIAKELVGKEGKRKVRTVIFRGFVYSFQEKRNIIESNIIMEWAKKYPLEQLRLLFLVKILMDYEITRFITNKIRLSFDHTNQLSSSILSKKMVQEYGDRDVVKRSVRSFLKTLVHFKILEQIGTQKYRLMNRPSMSNEQVKNFLLLYSKVFLKSAMIDLSNIDSSLLYYFKEIDLKDVAKKYHSKEWEYIRDVNRNHLLMKY
ncbi:MAG: hypothetical protein HOK80_05255 [Candidatus Cloacimonetes bacterium]|nr:hypothetical protein [Candidatus Cloacimonadota bacterium]